MFVGMKETIRNNLSKVVIHNHMCSLQNFLFSTEKSVIQALRLLNLKLWVIWQKGWTSTGFTLRMVNIPFSSPSRRLFLVTVCLSSDERFSLGVNRLGQGKGVLFFSEFCYRCFSVCFCSAHSHIAGHLREWRRVSGIWKEKVSIKNELRAELF